MAVTSTVLDVTVLLLCVSASVVALGASDAGGPGGPGASDAADRLVTETASVTYADSDAPNGTRRVHATRAELLALVAERDAEDAFDRRVTETVRAGLGPRARVDVTVERGSERDAGGPPALSPGDAFRPAWVERRSFPRPIADTAVPGWAIDGRASEGRSNERSDAVAVGPEPPRNADVTLAVVRQPIPTDVGRDRNGVRSSEGVVRIVVRRW
ncbi:MULTISPECIES: DUF7284 family protein [Halorubrum]|uniref:Uncharacterized protein n=1 Tax=Halorubrum hochstenium ATCC 700873 TaxID=1227481 RepID=M0FH40_9EURY|nr:MULTISPECIES: hypothetical protein [Halorubrum]ELZ58648.1 hypothetical protein C467_05437 [Halorubrum hochstenium ATCC 700873]